MAEILTDNYDYDFIGFTYNGKHSINDLKIYRTSDGSRYNETLNPTITDKTVEVIGSEGPILTSSYHKTRTFQIKFAYDSLTEEEFYNLSKVFDGKDVHDLIFDECPYKVYKAKVTGTPSLKYICFDNNGVDIYKGEGTVNFTCYEPYAFLNQTRNEEAAIEAANTIRAKIWLEPGNYILTKNGEKDPIEDWSVVTVDDKMVKSLINSYYPNDSTFANTIPSIKINSITKLINLICPAANGNTIQIKKYVGQDEIYYSGDAFFISPGVYVCQNKSRTEFYNFSFECIKEDGEEKKLNSSKYQGYENAIVVDKTYQVNSLSINEVAPQELLIISKITVDLEKDFETVAYFNGNEMIAPTAECVNGYSLYDYPTRDEWALHSPIPLTHFATGKNYGDIPASFVIKKGAVNEGDILLFHGGQTDNYSRALRIEETCDNFEWNTETGMVSGTIEGRTRAIKHYGNSTLKIPVGEDWSGYFTILKQQGYTIIQNTRLY